MKPAIAFVAFVLAAACGAPAAHRLAAVVAADLVTPLARAIADGRIGDGAVLFLAAIIAATVPLAER